MKKNLDESMRRYLDSLSFHTYMKDSVKSINDCMDSVIYGITLNFEGQKTKSFVIPAGSSKTFLTMFQNILFELSKISNQVNKKALEDVKKAIKTNDKEFSIL